MIYSSTRKFASCDFCNRPLTEGDDFMQSPTGQAICYQCAAEFASAVYQRVEAEKAEAADAER